MLNINNLKIAFIDTKLAQKICDKLNILFQKLIKVKFIRDYNEKTDLFITHVLYSIMIINEHRKNLTSLLITKLKNYKSILKKF